MSKTTVTRTLSTLAHNPVPLGAAFGSFTSNLFKSVNLFLNGTGEAMPGEVIVALTPTTADLFTGTTPSLTVLGNLPEYGTGEQGSE